MSLGVSNIIINQKRSSGGGAALAAQNGVSVAAANVVLGQNYLDPLNPAVLTNDREIPTGGHTIIVNITTANAKAFKVQGDFNNTVIGVETLNPNAGAAAKAVSQWTNDGNKILQVGIESAASASGANRRVINSATGIIAIGDTNAAGNSTALTIDDSTKHGTFNGNVIITGQVAAEKSLKVKGAAGQSDNIFEVQSSGNVALSLVTAAGRLGFTDYTFCIGLADVAFGNILGTSYAVIGAAAAQGVKFRDNIGNLPFVFEFNAGANPWADLYKIKTSSIAGGLSSAGKWKLGNILIGFVADGSGVEVEIDGTKYYLLTGSAA